MINLILPLNLPKWRKFSDKKKIFCQANISRREASHPINNAKLFAIWGEFMGTNSNFEHRSIGLLS